MLSVSTTSKSKFTSKNLEFLMKHIWVLCDWNKRFTKTTEVSMSDALPYLTINHISSSLLSGPVVLVDKSTTHLDCLMYLNTRTVAR